MSYPVLRNISDTIYSAIQKSRTPFTDSLLRIAIILGVSLIVMSTIEFILKAVFRRSPRGDDYIQTMSFILVLIRYTLLLTCAYIALRACISELTNMQANNIKDVILWLHTDTVTLFDYGIKILIALVIFLLFNAAQNGLIKILRRHLEKREVNETFSKVLINIIKYTLLAFLIVSSALQLMITGGDNIIFLAIYIYICVIIAVPFKSIQASLSGKNKGMDMLMSLISWTSGAILLIAVVVGLFNGISYLLHSGGTDITMLLREPQATIEERMNTVFLTDRRLTTTLKSKSGPSAKLTVETDGKLNLLFLDGVRVGINTSGRDYQFYNIAINQPEITAVRNMNYEYETEWEDSSGLEQNVSRTHYYCNGLHNDCLALTVNLYSNRVVNMTYYDNYKLIEPYLRGDN